MKIKGSFLLFFALLVACKDAQPRKPVNKKGISVLDKTVEINKKIFSNEQKQIMAYMQLDTLHTYINSNKGFWYTYVKKNNKGKHPVKGDEVSYSQNIVALNGEVIYSESELGLQNYFVDKEYVIKGVKEGIKIMREGETVKFIFSSFVAYRMNGDSASRIRSNEPIISTIQNLKINK